MLIVEGSRLQLLIFADGGFVIPGWHFTIAGGGGGGGRSLDYQLAGLMFSAAKATTYLAYFMQSIIRRTQFVEEKDNSREISVAVSLTPSYITTSAESDMQPLSSQTQKANTQPRPQFEETCLGT